MPSTPVVGDEDSEISIPDLSATLADTVTENGEEVVSVVIEGVPEDTRFSAGSQNGAGSWVFPVDALDTLTITPPEHYGGTMNLTLRAFTFESSNGDETEVSESFQIQVDPIADGFLIVARDVVLATSPSDLGFADLELRMIDDRDTGDPNELGPEYVVFTFDNVPDGVRMIPTSGGRLTTDGSGTYTFTGTADQASALNLITGPGTDAKFNYFIDITGVSVDGDNVLSPAITDQFRLTVSENDSTSVDRVAADGSNTLLQGDVGNDILTGLGGSDTLEGGDGSDLLVGGPGADEMTGGSGPDVFQWSLADLDGSLDDITDFSISEDILDLSDVFVSLGIDYDPQNFNVNDILVLTDTGGGAEISLADGTPIVRLETVSGTTIDALFSQGNLLI